MEPKCPCMESVAQARREQGKHPIDLILMCELKKKNKIKSIERDSQVQWVYNEIMTFDRVQS